MYFVLI